nr:hypothetical protein [uncultured Prevotella sp.]
MFNIKNSLTPNQLQPHPLSEPAVTDRREVMERGVDSTVCVRRDGWSVCNEAVPL